MRNVLTLATNNWQLKITAFVIACLLWLGVESDRPHVFVMRDVPVRIANHDPEWVVSAPPSPATVSVEFRAPLRELLSLSSLHPVVRIPVDTVSQGAGAYILQTDWVTMGGAINTAISIGALTPDTVHVSFDHVATKLVTLHASFRGALADGYELAAAPSIDPTVVRASGPARTLAALDTIQLQNIDVTGMHANDTVNIDIDTTGIGARISPLHVRVTIPIRPRAARPGGVAP